MRIKKHFLFAVFLLIFVTLFPACHLRISLTDDSLPTPSPSPVLAAPSNTAVPVPSSTLTITPAPTIPPTPTWTLFSNITVTPTQQWSACPGIVVTQKDTDAGDIIHILRCDDSLEYDLGPLAKGVYAVGPNNKFFIYVTRTGIVYGSRIGNPYLYPLFNLKDEQIFTALNRGVEPDFHISFSDGNPTYRLVLSEWNYGQKRDYILQPTLTH
jgi:hypothetical protein